MNKPTPPLITKSGNFNDIQVSNLQSSNGLNTGGATISLNNLGFFENSVTQQTSNGTLSSLAAVLKSYGLIGWLQQGLKLLGTGATGAAQQGYSVALSSDGNTLAIGGSEDNSSVGAVWVFTRTEGVWSQQGSKLTGTGYSGTSYQGRSLSLSADGNTMAVGGSFDNSAAGAVWIFSRSGSTWSQVGSKLVGTGAIGASQQGYSVSLSSDGTTLAVGGYIDNSNIGAVWIFTKSGSTWSQQGSKLVGTGATGAAKQGISVGLSSDGNTLVFGGRSDNSNVGAVWVFTRSGSTWSQQGSKLVGTDYVGYPIQGCSISLSADGNTLVSGGTSDNTTVGAAWVFTRTAGVWSQEGPKLVGTGATGDAYRGPVSISDDGNTIILAGSEDSSGIGAFWIFKKTNGVWVQQGLKLVGSGYQGGSYQGTGYNGIAISGDGYTIATGGPYDNSDEGATWVFYY